MTTVKNLDEARTLLDNLAEAALSQGGSAPRNPVGTVARFHWAAVASGLNKAIKHLDALEIGGQDLDLNTLYACNLVTRGQVEDG